MKICERWNTGRLQVRKAEASDTDELNLICISWEDKILLEGEGFSKGYIENSIAHGELPPIKNARADNYYFMAIQKKDGKMIGFFDLYHGYPDNETLWIGMFLVDKEVQGNSYGQEVIQSIFDECTRTGWKSVGLGVYLKNWKGLRFWNNNGFNKIIGIYGDKVYGENAFSIIGLKKELI